MKNVLSTAIIVYSLFIISCNEDKNPVSQTPSASKLFFTKSSADTVIGKIDLKNGNTTTDFAKGTASGLTGNTLVAITLNTKTGDIYVTNEENNGPIFKLNTNGIASIFYNGAEADSPGGIAYNTTNDKIYWINRGNGKVYSMNADGSGLPTALFGGVNVNAKGYSIQLDELNNKLYYANFYKIYVGNLDGTGTPTVLYDVKTDTLESPSNIALDVSNNKIYWTDEVANVVACANLDGTGNIKILYNNSTHGVTRSDGLAIDVKGSKIYWSETAGGSISKIRMGNLNGSGTPVTLQSGFDCYGLLLKFE
jgi:DNA-binding beta-propeller fold protein YncE